MPRSKATKLEPQTHASDKRGGRMEKKKEICRCLFEKENEQFINLQHLVFSPTQVVIRTATSLRKAFTKTLMHLLLLSEFGDLCLLFAH